MLQTQRASTRERLQGYTRRKRAADPERELPWLLMLDALLLQAEAEVKWLEPKVLDFGIAKALDQPPEQTALTRAGAWLGTPQYMSPEQIDDAADLDTRSDV